MIHCPAIQRDKRVEQLARWLCQPILDANGNFRIDSSINQSLSCENAQGFDEYLVSDSVDGGAQLIVTEWPVREGAQYWDGPATPEQCEYSLRRG
jgi:hypothetical protein